MKRIINIFHAILQLLILFLLLTKPLAFYYEEAHISEAGIHIAEAAGYIRFGNMFEGMTVLGIIATGLLICGIAVCIISAVRNTSEKDGAIHCVLPIITFVFMWSFVAWLGQYNAVGCFTDSWATDTSMMPIWTVIQIMMLISIVLGFVKRSKAIAPAKTTQQTFSTPIPTSQDSSADELKKYKDLLDNGVITQEEFDAKKKQLLGL